MVNATVDNEPVSITLDTNESTTVPTGEIWKVSIYLTNSGQAAEIRINGTGKFQDKKDQYSSGELTNVTLKGNDTIKEISNNGGKVGVFITGFVVNK